MLITNEMITVENIGSNSQCLCTQSITKDEGPLDSYNELKRLRLNHPRNIIIGYLNINSVRNKFENFSQMIKTDLDVIIIQSNRKKVTIIGDSIVNGLEERGLGKKHIVKVRKHPGATTTDMKDYIKPVQRRKPDCIILHAGTNDIGKDEIDTIANMREIIQETAKECPDTELVYH